LSPFLAVWRAAVLTHLPSPGRIRSLFLPQQDPRRDSSAHEATDG
jgi:hypothetical protein